METMGVWVFETVIGVLIIIAGYFLRMIHNDVRKNTEEIGKNKGRIEQQQLQLENHKEMVDLEIKNQNALTQQEIKALAAIVGELSENVKVLTGKI